MQLCAMLHLALEFKFKIARLLLHLDQVIKHLQFEPNLLNQLGVLKF